MRRPQPDLYLSLQPLLRPAHWNEDGDPPWAAGIRLLRDTRNRENRKIQRSASARADFMRQTGYPKGRKGYVVDHIVPLECGGADVASNMQWQTVQEAKIKDRTERNRRLDVNFRPLDSTFPRSRVIRPVADAMLTVFTNRTIFGIL
jgi:hypothetical protein